MDSENHVPHHHLREPVEQPRDNPTVGAKMQHSAPPEHVAQVVQTGYAIAHPQMVILVMVAIALVMLFLSYKRHKSAKDARVGLHSLQMASMVLPMVVAIVLWKASDLIFTSWGHEGFCFRMFISVVWFSVLQFSLMHAVQIRETSKGEQFSDIRRNLKLWPVALSYITGFASVRAWAMKSAGVWSGLLAMLGALIFLRFLIKIGDCARMRFATNEVKKMDSWNAAVDETWESMTGLTLSFLWVRWLAVAMGGAIPGAVGSSEGLDLSFNQSIFMVLAGLVFLYFRKHLCFATSMTRLVCNMAFSWSFYYGVGSIVGMLGGGDLVLLLVVVFVVAIPSLQYIDLLSAPAHLSSGMEKTVYEALLGLGSLLVSLPLAQLCWALTSNIVRVLNVVLPLSVSWLIIGLAFSSLVMFANRDLIFKRMTALEQHDAGLISYDAQSMRPSGFVCLWMEKIEKLEAAIFGTRKQGDMSNGKIGYMPPKIADNKVTVYNPAEDATAIIAKQTLGADYQGGSSPAVADVTAAFMVPAAALVDVTQSEGTAEAADVTATVVQDATPADAIAALAETAQQEVTISDSALAVAPPVIAEPESSDVVVTAPVYAEPVQQDTLTATTGTLFQESTIYAGGQSASPAATTGSYQALSPNPSASDLFDKLDKNHDGVLTREEFAGVTPKDLSASAGGVRAASVTLQPGQAGRMLQVPNAGKMVTAMINGRPVVVVPAGGMPVSPTNMPVSPAGMPVSPSGMPVSPAVGGPVGAVQVLSQPVSPAGGPSPVRLQVPGAPGAMLLSPGASFVQSPSRVVVQAAAQNVVSQPASVVVSPQRVVAAAPSTQVASP